MFVPTGTDAPLYHRPWATGTLIVLCSATWIAVTMANNDHLATMLCLEYGHGLKPWQWLTSLFMHAGLIHLLGNMVFLWVFGLVVEGKVGWLRFLAIYLGIGMGECAVEQVMMLGSDGGSLGASSAISGIMAIAALWAPRNEIDFVWIWSVMVKPFAVAIGWVVALYVALDVWDALTSGHLMTTGFLHQLGIGIGATVGYGMLRTQRVDCEGWDLLSLWRNHGEPALQHKAPVHPAPSLPEPPATVEQAESALRALLNQGRQQEAIEILAGAKRRLGPWTVPLDLLLPLAQAARALGDEEDEARLLQDFISRCRSHHPSRDASALRLAEVQLLRQRPSAALEALAGMSKRQLDVSDRQRLQACRDQAAALIASGAPEFH